MPLTTDTTKQIRRMLTPYLGSDPELFVATKGKIMGAEQVIPKAGITGTGTNGRSAIKLDGVQLELHPTPSHCRALIANDFKMIFKKLKDELEKKGAEASFDPVIKMSKDDLKKLSKEAQTLGCAPSKNIQNPTAEIKAKKSLTRSAGGHIHISFIAPGGYENYTTQELKHPKYVETFVKLFDCMVGLPCVLIDRDPQAATRRKLYGRASEHRTPAYGIEYRVLSNFWLRSYQLMSFVHGMVRQAVNVGVANNRNYNGWPWDAPAELFSRVDMDKVWEAINTNNYDKAMIQWKGVASFIDEFCADPNSGLASGPTNDNFIFFAEQVRKKGLNFWFPEDPMEHWLNIPEGHQFNDNGFAGWESFISSFVESVKADVQVDDVLAKLRAA